MKKRYSGLVLCMALTAVVLAGCGQKEAPKTTETAQTLAPAESGTTAQEGSKTDQKDETAVYGKVEALEGQDSVMIKLGELVENPTADTGAFKESGEKQTVHIGKDVKVTAEEQGKETTVDINSLSEGALIEIGYDSGNPATVELLNNDLVLFADQIKKAFAGKDVDALDGLLSYPIYFTNADGNGMDVADKEALTKVKDAIFSKDLSVALASFDPSTISPLNVGFVIGSESGSPSVEFDRFPGGKLKITMINASK